VTCNLVLIRRIGAGLIVGGVVGGAVAAPIMGTVADARGTAFAMVVPLCFMIASWSYAIVSFTTLDTTRFYLFTCQNSA
jgi:fucose permease